jgi:uncharacterized protein (DUF58 family)
MSTLAKYLDPEVIQQVAQLDLRARFIVEGFLAGLHASPFRGFSVEFSEHRKYVKGDDIRSIDWNVFARTDRLYSRQYNAETQLDCYLLVDASASMGYVGTTAPEGGEPAGKLLYATHLAAAVGYLVTHQQDAVGMGILGEGLEHFLPARSRRQHLIQLLRILAAVKPSGRTGLGAGIRQVLAQIPHRGLIVMLSDLLTDQDEVTEALHHIRFAGHDVIVMHILDAAEVRFPFEGGLRLEDPESGETLVADADAVRQRYERAVADWRAELADRLRSVRIDYVPLDTSMPFDKALIEFLGQRGRRR